MVAPRVNGRRIADYKDVTVRETGLAVVEAEPLYRGGVSDGYRVDDFIADDSLVLYLPLYRLLGASFNSQDRFQHTAIVTGALWRPTGRLMDGNDNIVIPRVASLDITEFSMQIWIRPRVVNISDQTLFEKESAGFAGFWFRLDQDDMQYLYNAGTAIFADVIPSLAWSDIMLTYDGTTLTYYRDTAVIGVPAVVNFINGLDDLTIGARDGSGAPSNEFDGIIGEAAIWNRGISAEEVIHQDNVTRWRYQ